MKNIINPLVAAITAAAPIFASLPAHAQWVAQNAVPVEGHKINNTTYYGNSTGSGQQGQFYASASISGSWWQQYNTNSGGLVDEGNQWTVTYIWTGSGNAPNAVVAVTDSVTASAGASGSAKSHGGGSADALGVTSDNNGGANSKQSTTNNTISSGASTLTVTVEAKANGQSNASGDTFSGSGDATVTLGNPK